MCTDWSFYCGEVVMTCDFLKRENKQLLRVRSGDWLMSNKLLIWRKINLRITKSEQQVPEWFFSVSVYFILPNSNLHKSAPQGCWQICPFFFHVVFLKQSDVFPPCSWASPPNCWQQTEDEKLCSSPLCGQADGDSWGDFYQEATSLK